MHVKLLLQLSRDSIFKSYLQMDGVVSLHIKPICAAARSAPFFPPGREPVPSLWEYLFCLNERSFIIYVHDGERGELCVSIASSSLDDVTNNLSKYK